MTDVSEGSWINPRHLVKVLVQEPFFRASLVLLLEDKQLQPPKVRRLVTTYPQLFRLNEEVVELHPRVAICRAYRRPEGCSRPTSCRRLHICVKYLAGDCDRSECAFSHEWDAEPNARILYEKFLEELSPNTLCKLIFASYKELCESGSSQEDTTEKEKDERPTGLKTLSTNDQDGDVRIPEICHKSVNGTCDLEENGCPRLHAHQHFHWQVRKTGESWYNLPETQVKQLEQASSNPANDSIALTRLEPERNGPIQIMGRDLWEANLETSSLKNDNGEILELRRLCSEVRPDEKILESTYLWYINLDGSWKCFGISAGGDPLISGLTSETIEHSYSSKDISIARFRVGRNSCIMNFKSMFYTNEKTSISHRLRRRPYPHLPEGEQFDIPPLPPTWQEMPTGEPFIKVPLNPFTYEYQEVIDNLVQAGMNNSKVTKVERIQNPVLWRRFQRRVLEMLESHVNTRFLFHCTKLNAVLSICENNFDWELQDSGYTDRYGQGNCFISDAKRAFRRCERDDNNSRYLFVAKVAVGKITVGDSSMTGPPVDPENDICYDTTVDNEENPTFFIKYTKDECYPGYLVTMN